MSQQTVLNARHRELGAVQCEGVRALNHRLECTATDFINRHATRGRRQPRVQRRLPRRRLSHSRLQHIAHENIPHIRGRQTRFFDGGANYRRAESRGRDGCERTLERTERRSGGGEDDNVIHAGCDKDERHIFTAPAAGANARGAAPFTDASDRIALGFARRSRGPCGR